MSLTPSDLQKIGEVVEEKVFTKLGEVVEEKVEQAFSKHFGSIWEQNLEPAFEALHATIATKDDIVGVNRTAHNIADAMDAKIMKYMDGSERRDEALLKRQDLAMRKLEEK